MTKRHFTISALAAEDARAYNELLGRAATEHPDSLRISPADIASSPFATGDGEGGCTLVARDDDGSWLGVVTVEREQGREKRRHIGWVLRMYVKKSATGRGVGRALLLAALERARRIPGVTKVNLTVAEHNVAAVHLYESVGFRPFSREVDAFRDGESRTELTMSLAL